ncbi:MAG TPA: carboxynorspermidine decarboxylase [Bacillota bacterium]|nr:carboxynorspermidine decarboxylase [Bacillota bacterium]HOK68616.1 carboxynorspermidine decarboxylase [Bacillota bacterium]HPP84728.1 carboxynorspermidine decarboxylase [Bacillota bacterium]
MEKLNFDINALPTPYIVVDEQKLVSNLEILKGVMDETGCRILLAQKAFAMFSLYPLIGEYLSGTTASGLFEAKLGYEEMGKENHIFSPAYTQEEFDEILQICGHIVFNSFSQWEKFKDKALKSGRKFGIRVNPELSTQDHAIYDPCAYGSRLGVTEKNFRPDLLEGISGLHFHTLCEQNSDALEKTLEAFEAKFGKYLYDMEWVNFGGGHHITRPDYDIQTLIKCIKRIQEKYDVVVYLEPGEAVVLNTGYLVASVIDIVENGVVNCILDTSAACHMPDVIEMPYRPEVIGAGKPGEKPYTYRLGGPTCLAGDIIGDYSFDNPLKIGDRVVFCDMSHYSMVKSNMFNGMNLPAIAVADRNGAVKLIKSFGYDDYKNRLS